MKEVLLGDLIQPAKAWRAGHDEYPILSMTMHEGLVEQGRRFKKRVASKDTSGYKVVSRGQLVVGFPIDEGVLDFQTLYDSAVVSPAYGVWDLTDSTRVHIHYLKRFLRSSLALSYYKAKLRGSTARRRSLPAELFLALPVPLPTVGSQRRIVGILDQIDAVRAKRRQVLAYLDTLNQSMFHDMFVAPRFAYAKLGDICKLYSGGTPPKKNSAYWSGNLPWFSAKDLKARNLYDSYEHVSKEVPDEMGLRLLPANTISIVVRGMILARAVPISILRVESTINQDLKAVIPYQEVDTEFLAAAIRAQESWLLARTSTAAHGTRRIESRILEEVPVPIVPLGAQREFAARAAQVDAQKVVAQRALDADNELFASLQWRAFRGEL